LQTAVAAYLLVLEAPPVVAEPVLDGEEPVLDGEELVLDGDELAPAGEVLELLEVDGEEAPPAAEPCTPEDVLPVGGQAQLSAPGLVAPAFD